MFVIETAIYMIPVYEERQKIQYMYIVERYVQDRTIKVEKNLYACRFIENSRLENKNPAT